MNSNGTRDNRPWAYDMGESVLKVIILYILDEGIE